jgi:hypothetical protein
MDREKIYSEIRYITIELMKIANERKVSFKKVAKEFIDNVNDLIKMIESNE